MEATQALMNHDGIATILATGGNAMVRAAYSCGKPALGVGAGNVPAYVEKTADIRQAAHDIVMSKSFDNGMVCASEQAVIIDKEIYDEFIDEFKSYKVYFVNKKRKGTTGRILLRRESQQQRLRRSATECRYSRPSGCLDCRTGRIQRACRYQYSCRRSE